MRSDRSLRECVRELLRRRGGGLQSPQVLRHVEIGFVERERLDERGVSAKMAWIWRETAR